MYSGSHGVQGFLSLPKWFRWRVWLCVYSLGALCVLVLVDYSVVFIVILPVWDGMELLCLYIRSLDALFGIDE